MSSRQGLKKAPEADTSSITISTVGNDKQLSEANKWVIDSFCCHHLTGKKSILSDREDKINEFSTGKIDLLVTESGNVRIKDLTLSDVAYCPRSRSSIISEGQLDREGYSFTRFNNKCTIQQRKTLETVGEAYQDDNSLYYVEYLNCDLASKMQLKVTNFHESAQGSMNRRHQLAKKGSDKS